MSLKFRTAGNNIQGHKNVILLNTIHMDATVPVAVTHRHKHAKKTECVVQYNKYIGAVDFKDRMLRPYLEFYKHWYKKWPSTCYN